MFPPIRSLAEITLGVLLEPGLYGIIRIMTDKTTIMLTVDKDTWQEIKYGAMKRGKRGTGVASEILAEGFVATLAQWDIEDDQARADRMAQPKRASLWPGNAIDDSNR